MDGDDAWTFFLLRYGELGIKSRHVRRRFEKQLVDNLQAHFSRAGKSCVIDRIWGRIFLETPDDAFGRAVIERTFGLVHGSPVQLTDADLDSIEEVVRAIALEHVSAGETFAIRARRTGEHPFESPDIGERCGAAVLDEVPGAEVDLDDPDKEIHVEVRNADAYVFTEFLQAPGGLPMGSQGQVVVPIEGPRSPAAAWLSMRRGSSVHALVPADGLGIVETLEPWAPGMRYTVLDAPISREGLMAAAEVLAQRLDANALALSEHEARALDADAFEVPVLRPLAGLPGRRWPGGAYRVSKQAAEEHPGPCTDPSGLGPEDAVALLGDARIQTL